MPIHLLIFRQGDAIFFKGFHKNTLELLSEVLLAEGIKRPLSTKDLEK